MSDEMDAAVAVMDAAVAEAVTVDDSADVLIRSIAAKIIELQNEPARLVAYANTLTASSAKLKASVVENTPAQP